MSYACWGSGIEEEGGSDGRRPSHARREESEYLGDDRLVCNLILLDTAHLFFCVGEIF